MGHGKLLILVVYQMRNQKTRKEFRSFFTRNHGSTIILCGYFNRSKIIESTVEGTLVIKVQMKIDEPEFIPENPLVCKNLQSLFLDEKFSDLTFEVVRVNFRRTMKRRWQRLCGSGGDKKLSIKN